MVGPSGGKTNGSLRQTATAPTRAMVKVAVITTYTGVERYALEMSEMFFLFGRRIGQIYPHRIVRAGHLTVDYR